MTFDKLLDQTFCQAIVLCNYPVKIENKNDAGAEKMNDFTPKHK